MSESVNSGAVLGNPVPTEDAEQSDEEKAEEIPRLECISCTNQFKAEDTIDLECNHVYCIACIDQVFTNACQDFTMFPPKCCKAVITLASVQTSLSREVLLKFQAKQEEHKANNATYCHDVKCAQFIPMKNAKEQVAICPACKKETCCLCKQRRHDDNECPKDQGLEDLKVLAKAKQWRRCPTCKSYVERISGCNHMTCRFVYVDFLEI